MGKYLKITIVCPPSQQEVLIAGLSATGFDSFWENDTFLEAFIEEENFDKNSLNTILGLYGLAAQYKIEEIENANWNKLWEENFEPVIINDIVRIRATFHKPSPEFKYEIIINPKMSFGTGHHQTTRLIISEQSTIDHKDKSVLDVGTGTGILSIMAYKLGAKTITATDIDDWCIENSRENFELNGLENFTILQGTIDNLTLSCCYDIIIANINKNVLLNELPYYAKLLTNHGVLILSGFYEQDVNDLRQKAIKHQLNTEKVSTLDQWAMIKLVRSY